MLEKIQFSTLMLAHDPRVRRDDRGATAVEYALLVSLIAAVIMTIVGTVGQELLPGFTTLANALP